MQDHVPKIQIESDVFAAMRRRKIDAWKLRSVQFATLKIIYFWNYYSIDILQ